VNTACGTQTVRQTHSLMKTYFRLVGVGALLALAAPVTLLAQTEPIIAVDFTQIAVISGSGSVIDLKVNNGGAGYSTAPTVSVIGGGGVGAMLTATVTDGVVTGLNIVEAGTGYTSFPTISISAPGAAATATASPNPNSNPAGQIDQIAVASGGSGYSSAPIIEILGDGTGAKATATVANGVVTAITVTNKGSGYTSAAVVIPAPGTPATATVQALGTLFLDPEQNESYGPVGAGFNMTAEARGLFPVGGYTYDFFVNGVALGSSVVPQPRGGGPGSIGWAPPQPGAYTLTVVASGAGHTATSLPIRYFATGTSIIGPTDNTLVPNGSSVVVQATATPAPSGPNAFVQRVEFYVDSVLVATDTTYPYSFIYTPAPSPTTHVIEARGFDNNGNQISPSGTPAAMRRLFMVSPTGAPPVVRIANPPNEGSVQAGSAVNIIADAAAPDGFIRKVEFYVNGVLLSASQTFPFTAAWTPQVPGRYQFVAIAFDDKSNAVSSTPIMLTATGSFPTVSIIQPERNGFTIVQGSTLPVSVRAAGPDGGIVSLKSIEFLVDGVVNDSLPKAPTTTTTGGTTTTTTPVLAEPFVFNWKSNVAIGTHRLAARVTSMSNLSITSSEITVNVVANQPPTVALTGPTESTSVTMNVATTLTAVPSDVDGSVESVEFFVNGNKVGTATKSPFQVSWTPTTSGTFAITARAIDNSGAAATSAAVSVVVDPPPPPSPTQSTIAFTVYRGDYGSIAESGRFALGVNRNNRGTLIAFSTAPAGRTYFWTDITINPDGTFAVRDANNQVAVSGQTSATGVSGTFGDKTLIGPVTPSTGSFTPLLVTGTLTGVPNSQVAAIVGGDGTVTVYATSGAGREAGTDFLTSTGTYSFAAPTGGRITGTVANSAALVSGSISGSVSGSFLLRQQASRISNISTRALAGSGDRTLVAGFVVSGSGSKPLLVRAIGPTLASFGVANPLVDPTLNVLSRTSVSLASNNDWGNSAALVALSTQVGAFPLTPGSRDAAAQASVTPGTYTAVVGGGGATLGSALIEIYDADTSNPATSRVTNISTRGQVGAGEPLIAGFVITGDVRKKVLIRAVGPTLASFGLTGLLADPKIEVLSGTTSIATNNDWTDAASVAQVNATSPIVGAFPLNAGSKDAALVLQLTPGSYTVQISGAGTSAGTVLVEIYDADL
jgi:hypothetical protein